MAAAGAGAAGAAAAAVGGADGGGRDKQKRGRKWTVVVNFDGDWDWEPEELMRGWKYCCWQREEGTNKHLQMYVETMQMAMSTLQKLMGEARPGGGGGYWMPAAGSGEANKHYCSKPHEGCECEHCEDERAKPTAVAGSFKELGTMAKPRGTGSGVSKRKLAFDAVRENASKMRLRFSDGAA